MKRTPIVAGNWKMNKTVGEAVSFIKELKRLVKTTDKEVIVCPPFTALYSVSSEIKKSYIRLSAQNMYHEKNGAFTGEISPVMLKDIGCSYVIIGHSERRHIFKETDDMINKKIRLALDTGLNPILCVGETLSERKSNSTKKVVLKQIQEGLKSVEQNNMEHVVIAYEPVWAIGTGNTATPDQAQEVHLFIRETIANMFGKKIAEEVRILYGGSVTPENIKELMTKDDIDGALVGGSSLDVLKFSRIIGY